MEIPLKIRARVALKGIKEWSIIWFQDNDLTNPGPHWYIIIPTSDASFFLLNMITSQSNKRVKFYQNTKRPKAVECLVKLSNNEFSFLSLNSVIDCNRSEHLSADEIIHRMDEAVGFRINTEKIPAYLKKEIVSAIVGSPLIAPFIKKIAKTTNPL